MTNLFCYRFNLVIGLIWSLLIFVDQGPVCLSLWMAPISIHNQLYGRINKKNFVRSIFPNFPMSTSLPHIYEHVPIIKTKRNKRSGGSILQIFIRSTFKTWNTMQKRYIFFIWFWLVFYPFWYCLLSVKKKNPFFCLTDKIC